MSVTRSRQVKQATRQYMLARRRARDHAARGRDSRLVRNRIAALPEYRLAGSIALYLGMPDEVDLDALIELARAAGKRTAVPVWRADRRDYGFREVTGLDGLRPGHYGLREPAGGAWVQAAAFDLILVPGTAFDRRGMRVGMGGGWYDRLLAAAGDAVRAGVAFDFQVAPALPYAVHDVTMHLVVTESATWRKPRGMGVPPIRHGQDARASVDMDVASASEHETSCMTIKRNTDNTQRGTRP